MQCLRLNLFSVIHPTRATALERVHNSHSDAEDSNKRLAQVTEICSATSGYSVQFAGVVHFHSRGSECYTRANINE
jgi:hypothetical protein